VNIHWRAVGDPRVVTDVATSTITELPEPAIEMITSVVRRASTPVETEQVVELVPATSWT
jgi:hypothetical protein